MNQAVSTKGVLHLNCFPFLHIPLPTPLSGLLKLSPNLYLKSAYPPSNLFLYHPLTPFAPLFQAHSQGARGGALLKNKKTAIALMHFSTSCPLKNFFLCRNHSVLFSTLSGYGPAHFPSWPCQYLSIHSFSHAHSRMLTNPTST